MRTFISVIVFYSTLILSSGCTSLNKNITFKKKSNYNHCSKTVTIFIDKVSEQELITQNISFQKVLELANKKLADQSIAARYDVKSAKIKSWKRSKLRKWESKFNGNVKTPGDFLALE